jgi:glycosyltransferase involved in cell wall biosynthesis
MKIAMVTAFWGPAYPTGSGIYAYEVARRLAEQSNEVHVYTSSVGNFNEVKYPDNLHVHVLRAYGVVWDMNPLANVFTRLLREDFDIVHVHSYIFFMSNMAALARIFRDFRYVLHFHGGLNYSEAKMFYPWRVWAKENIYDRLPGLFTVKMADEVLSVAKSDIPIIKKKFGVDADWIPNGVCTEKFSYSESDSRIVTYVGKLEKWKGAETLIDVFKIIHKELKDVEFIVAGDGSLAGRLRNTNLPVKLIGHVPHDKMPEIYHKSAVSVLPSYMEGLPTTCMESLACGVPVVATDVGDTKEVVIDGETGFLVKPGDTKTMAHKVIELLEDEDSRKNMGKEGRRHVEENFSYDAIIQKLCDIYTSLI